MREIHLALYLAPQRGLENTSVVPEVREVSCPIPHFGEASFSPRQTPNSPWTHEARFGGRVALWPVAPSGPLSEGRRIALEVSGTSLQGGLVVPWWGGG
jgi:hypothetical protein